MQQTIRFLSDTRRVAEILRGARLESVTSAQARRGSTVTAMLKRPRIESAGEGAVSSRVVLRGVRAFDERQSSFPPGHRPFLYCESDKDGYVCLLSHPDGTESVLRMPALDGLFEDC